MCKRRLSDAIDVCRAFIGLDSCSECRSDGANLANQHLLIGLPSHINILELE